MAVRCFSAQHDLTLRWGSLRTVVHAELAMQCVELAILHIQLAIRNALLAVPLVYAGHPHSHLARPVGRHRTPPMSLNVHAMFYGLLSYSYLLVQAMTMRTCNVQCPVFVSSFYTITIPAIPPARTATTLNHVPGFEALRPAPLPAGASTAAVSAVNGGGITGLAPNALISNGSDSEMTASQRRAPLPTNPSRSRHPS